MKKILDEIAEDVTDMKSRKFDYINTKSVPFRHDPSLTFENGKDKIGKILKTCVLFVDIRNSVDLNKTHSSQTMGRLYTIFSKSMTKLARYHKGYVRNIIGDRLMIVFPEQYCFTNAVNCAISINHVCHRIINKVFIDVDFKCGIGIDYGEMKIVKVGLYRKGNENVENKNLVWIGFPANIASRLTDVANKSVDRSKIEVTYKPFNFFGGLGGLGTALGIRAQKGEGVYIDRVTTREHTLEDFAKQINFNDTLGITYSGGKFIKFVKKEFKIDFPTILMTENVFVGFKNEDPNRKSIKLNLWKEVKEHSVKNVSSKVFGGSVFWEV